jgi:hypothetical protein
MPSIALASDYHTFEFVGPATHSDRIPLTLLPFLLSKHEVEYKRSVNRTVMIKDLLGAHVRLNYYYSLLL